MNNPEYRKDATANSIVTAEAIKPEDAMEAHLDQLARMYVEAYTTGHWEGEKHDEAEMREKFKEWIDSENHWVKVLIQDEKIVCFIVYRTVPISQFVEDLTAEMMEVSDVEVSDEERQRMQQVVDNLISEDLMVHSGNKNKLIGIIQDIVSSSDKPDQLLSLKLIIATLEELMSNANIRALSMYTRIGVSTKNVAERLGGELIYQKPPYVVHIAPTDVVKNKLSRYQDRLS